MVTKFFHVLADIAHVEGLLLLGLLELWWVVTSIVDDLLLLLGIGLAVPVVSREVAILTEVL